MIRHLVMFRRKAEVPAQPELEQSLVAGMQALVEHIDFARHWEVAANEQDRPICWDYVLDSRFDDDAALVRYLEHPAHVALVSELRRYFEWAAVDYTEQANDI